MTRNPEPTSGGMSENWQAGDLALCIETAGESPTSAERAAGVRGCVKGGIYQVERVITWLGKAGLVLAGNPSSHETKAYIATAFLRIPPHAPDAEDRETIALLTGKPATVEV